MSIDLTLGDTEAIIGECKKQGLSLQQGAYVLATAFWETNHTIKPVEEAYWLSENWRKNNLSYYPWHGRGYVQLTWEGNYARAEKELELGTLLTDTPDKAMEPHIAKQTIVKGMVEGWFTGKRLSDYINEKTTDYVNARRIVNGTDKAAEIATLAEQYETQLVNQLIDEKE